jgi:hypothetical protein
MSACPPQDHLDTGHLAGGSVENREVYFCMFGRKKPIFNGAFGEIEFFGTAWRTVNKISFSLFGKSYLVHAKAVVTSRDEEINQLQEIAFKSIEEIVANRRSVLEDLIIRHFETVSGIEDYTSRYKESYDLDDIASRFIPTDLVFSRKGECGLYVEDDAEEYGKYDDWDEGFVVSIIPEFEIHSKERYSGLIHGGGTL